MSPSTEPETTSVTAADTASGAEPSASAAESSARVNRKVREGTVVSNKMEKTLTVAVIERVRHPKYGKFMMRTKKLYVHDETNDANIGDKVRVMETRPLSKNKRWRLVEILERAK
jgi:small subunit ribosomal protein S17